MPGAQPLGNLPHGAGGMTPPGSRTPPWESGFQASFPDAAGGCTDSTIAAAAQRFDQTVQAFRKGPRKRMLPGEVKNLQRVVHTLEVLRHSILRDLPPPGVQAMPTGDLVNSCQRYFAGVDQLESDLLYFNNQRL